MTRGRSTCISRIWRAVPDALRASAHKGTVRSQPHPPFERETTTSSSPGTVRGTVPSPSGQVTPSAAPGRTPSREPHPHRRIGRDVPEWPHAPVAFCRRPPTHGSVDKFDHDVATSGRRSPARGRAPAADQRGVYAPFIAIIASALLFLGGIAYDGPRLTAARQDAVHAANEAARVAAATIASGGTLEDAEDAAQERVRKTTLIYGQNILVASLDCVGSRVQVTVVTGYVFRSALGLIRDRQPIAATGAAEAYLVLPADTRSDLSYLGECPL